MHTCGHIHSYHRISIGVHPCLCWRMASVFLSQDIAFVVLRFVDVRSLALAGCVCKSWKEHVDFLSQLPQWITAYSNEPNFEDAIKTVFARCSAPSFRPNVAFLFVSDTYAKLDEDVIASEIAKLPPLHLGGCTGSGIIGYDQDQKKPVEAEPTQDDEDGMPRPVVAVSLALAHVPSCDIDSFCITDDEDLADMVAAVKDKVKDSRRSVNFVVLADAKTRAHHLRMGRLVQTLDESFPNSEVTGGVASGFHRSGTTRVLWGDKGGKDGAAMTKVGGKTPAAKGKGLVALRGACTVISMVTAEEAMPAEGEEPSPLTYASVARSFSAIGPAFTVAAVEGPVIQMVRAQDDTGQAVGDEVAAGHAVRMVAQQVDLDEECEVLCGVAARPKPNSSELRLHRGILVDNGGLLLDLDREQNVPQIGSTLQLMSDGNPRDMETCVHEQLRWTQQLMSSKPGFGNRVVDGGRALSKSMVRGGLLFSCCGRGARCYGRPNVDSEAFQAAFPQSVGVCGFFCDGEIGPTHLGSKETQLHGFTSVYTLFEGI